MHRGAAFFGNVGAPRRLDFTVIGRAVNTAARIEGLCKETQRPLLVTEPVAALSNRRFDDLGTLQIRGLAAPIALYGLALEPAAPDASSAG